MFIGRYSYVASAAFIGGASLLMGASPANTQSNHITVRPPTSGLGEATVIGGSGYTRVTVCAHQNTYSIRGEFRGPGWNRNVGRTSHGCTVPITMPGPVTSFRACGPTGCSSWKSI